MGSLMVRFDTDSGSLAITRTIEDLDTRQSVSPRTLQSTREERAERIRPLTEIISLMALVTLLLAVSGVYGTVAFSMIPRTREIGVRTVLGATKGRILRSVLVSGIQQINIGLAAGLFALPHRVCFSAARTKSERVRLEYIQRCCTGACRSCTLR